MRRFCVLAATLLLGATGRGGRAEMEAMLGKLPAGARSQTTTARLGKGGTRTEVTLP